MHTTLIGLQSVRARCALHTAHDFVFGSGPTLIFFHDARWNTNQISEIVHGGAAIMHGHARTNFNVGFPALALVWSSPVTTVLLRTAAALLTGLVWAG